MCGICGMYLFDSDNPVDPILLERMNSTLAHRGPDDEGYYINKNVGLAMRRLSIIDLPSGRQPITNEDGNIVIVFNGEIYNYLELRSDLVSRGHSFRTRSDTEVIVHLYEEYGSQCVQFLNGMFAFAIWDGRNQEILIARDRFGIKPLHYTIIPGLGFFFGSEIKAVLEAPVPRQPDLQAIYDYLSLMYVPTPSTAYKNIYKLPPATTLKLKGNSCDLQQYWDIPLPNKGEETADGNYLSDLTESIQAAIKRHMIADVQVGAFLSGGLDSTTVAAIMSKKLDVPLQTFTIGFQHASYDEAPDAGLVSQILNTGHIEEYLENPLSVGNIDDVLSGFDEPFADYSAIPTYAVAKLARKYVKVVLTGDGGDEIFAGYPTHTAFRVSQIFRLIPEIIRSRIVKPLILRLPTSFDRVSFDYKAKRFVTGVDLPWQQGHFWWKVIFNENQKKELLKPIPLRDLSDTYRIFDQYFGRASHADELNQLLYVDAKTFLLDDNLVKVDRMTMANSIEARVPFLDYRLAEQVALLPPKLKSSGLTTKKLLRSATKSLLPKAIRKGKKRGFTPPLPHWINNELKDYVAGKFSSVNLEKVGILDKKYCNNLLAQHLSGQKDNNREIWTLVALINWTNKFNVSF